MEQLLNDCFLAVLNMSISASFVIVVIWLTRLLLAKTKAPGIFSYGLWGVALFRLLCPFSFESVLSLIPVNSQTVPPAIVYSPIPQIESGIGIVDRAVNNVLPAATPYASANPMQLLVIGAAYMWAAVVLGMLLYSMITYITMKRRVSRALLIDNNIYECESISSPFVLGIIKPKIYLPMGIGGDEYAYIVTHEQTHIRRKDYLVKPLALLALCLHWFNPMCWLAFRLCVKDMEMSCDEAVIKKMGSGIKRGYSNSLLSMAGNHPSFGSSPLAFGESNIKSRIKNILNYRRPALWVIVAAVIVVLVVGCGLLTSPQNEDANQSPASKTEHSEEIKLVEDFLTKLYTVNDYEGYRSYLDELEAAGTDRVGMESVLNEYNEGFRPFTTQDCYDGLVADRLTEYAPKFSLEHGYLFEVTEIVLTVDVEDEENLQFKYVVNITATPKEGSVDTRTTTGTVALKNETDGVMRINGFRFDRAYYTPLTQANSNSAA